MKAAVIYKTGPAENLQYEDVPDPKCRPKGVLVRVRAISLEGGDSLHRLSMQLDTVPHIVGYQAAGEIMEVGENVKEFRVGQRVVTTGANGSHAELRSAPTLSVFALPDNLSFEQGSTIPIPFGTAHECLFEFGGLQAGQTVLIHAGASGVGLAAIQLAKRAGAKVITTASTASKLERLQQLGADHCINYVTSDFVEAVKEYTQGRGVNIVVDPVGGETLERSIDCLAHRGIICSMGQAGRVRRKIDLGNLSMANRAIRGVYFGSELPTPRVQEVVRNLIADVAKGELKVFLDQTFSLENAAAAHRRAESREAFGRVIIKP